jgi:hypothetical protein
MRQFPRPRKLRQLFCFCPGTNRFFRETNDSMMSRKKVLVSSTACLVVILVAACSKRPKNVAPVKGKVTVAGQPLGGAQVIFSPTAENASSSTGGTNASGEYVLQYSKGVKGAVIGEHTVSISTHQEGDPNAKPPIPDVPEKVPYKYRTPGPDQLKATVKPGNNAIDFTLENGPIEPPAPKGKAKKR